MSRRRPKPHRTGRWYVDNAASGTNAGTSWTNAWTSFASINWSSVAAGDTIFISGGSVSKTYTTVLTAGKSGTAGKPITLTKGADPGHNGTVIIDGASSTTQDSTTAIVSNGGFTNLIIQNLTSQNTLQDCIRISGVSSGTVLVQNNTVHTGTGLVTVNTNGATAAGSAVLNFASVPANIQSKAVDGLAVKNATASTVLPSTVRTVSATATTVTLDQNATGAGVASGNTIQFAYQARGIFVTTTSGTGVVQVRNNLIDAPATIAASKGIHLQGNTAGSVVLEDNAVTINNNDAHAGSEGIVSYQDATVTIRNNSVTHTAASTSASLYVGDIRAGSNISVYNNVLQRPGGDYAGIFFNNDDAGYTGGLKVWNNTIYGAWRAIWLQSPTATTEIKNNLFYIPDGNTGIYQQVGFSAALAAANIDYNAYLGTGAAIEFGNSASTSYATFAAWQGTGYEAHGVGSGSAAFVNAGTGDFHLGGTSAAIDRGIVLSASFVTDKDGRARSLAAYDIGAYEATVQTVPLPTAPTGLTLLNVSSTTVNVGMNVPVIDFGGILVRYEVAASPGYVDGPVAYACSPGVGAITDSLSNSWAITTDGVMVRNGVTDGTTSNVVAGWVVNGVFWQQNSQGLWYSWTGAWSAGTSTSPLAGGGIQITGLTASTAYNVRALAFNTTGSGPAASPITATTSASSTGGDQNGVQAGRIADLMERFGFNIYSSLQDDGSNLMGTYPAVYSVAGCTFAYKWFTGSTAMVMWARLWTEGGQSWVNVLTTWAPDFYKATGANISVETRDDGTLILPLAAASHNGTGASVGAQGWFKLCEGTNEPNGMGAQNGTTIAANDSGRATNLAAYSEIELATASLIIGLPNPEGYDAGTFQTNPQKLTSITAAPIINIHYYPSQNPDFEVAGSNDGSEADDVDHGEEVIYNVSAGSHRKMVGEWHSTLFMLGANPNAQGGRWDDSHDSYYTFIYIMTSKRLGWDPIIWYALYDFGTAYTTGMWHTDARTETPRAEAYVVRAMFQLLGESNAVTKGSFTTSKLNYTVTGLPGPAAGNSLQTGGHHALYQNSDGRFGLFIWNSQASPGGTAVNVTVNLLGNAATRLAHYDLTTDPPNNMTALAIQNGPLTSFTFPLTASGHLLLIDVAASGGVLPTAPQNPTVGVVTSSTIALGVGQPATVGTGTLTYTWQRSLAGANSWITAGTSTSAASSVTFTYSGLSASTSYDLRVSVTNSAGTGPYSTTATGATSASTGLPGDLNGTTARRIADMMETFGANCYPNGQGGSSAGASVAQHSVAFNYLCGGSGMGLYNRIYANSTGLDVPFITQLSNAFPGTKWNSAVNWTASSVNVVVAEAQTQSLYSTGILAAVEGYNEPNEPNVNDIGVVPVANCLSAQQTIWNAAHPNGIKVFLPSVADRDGSNTYLTDYMGATSSSNFQAFMAASDYYNGHDYPNTFSFTTDAARRTTYLSTTTGGKQGGLTEYHPYYYNQAATKTEAYAAYAAPIALLSGHVDFGILCLQWWSLYDYVGFSPAVGLFRGADPNNPTPAATVFRSMYQLTTDLGTTKRSFLTSKLAYTISNLAPANSRSTLSGGRSALFQNSSGTFFLFVWNDQDAPGGATRSVTLTLTGGARSRIRRYNLTTTPASGMTALQDVTNASTITWNMAAEVDLIRIDW